MIPVKGSYSNGSRWATGSNHKNKLEGAAPSEIGERTITKQEEELKGLEGLKRIVSENANIFRA